MRNFIIVLFLATILIALFIPSPASAGTTPGTGNVVRTTDFAGNVIELPQAAQRIVVLAPHIVENLFAIGAGQQIVGVVKHSDFPKEAQTLPIVGGYETVNFERIVQLQPDLILAWESGNSLSMIERFKTLGIPIFLDQPDRLDDIATSLRKLGILTGHTLKAETVASNFINELEKTRKANSIKRLVRTFYQVWNEPLITISGDHVISDAIRACGGQNVFANEVAIAPTINVEALIERNPEAIIASGMSEHRPEWLDEWKEWPALQATQADNLFFVNPDYIQRHTTRQLLAIRSICKDLDRARAKNKQSASH